MPTTSFSTLDFIKDGDTVQSLTVNTLTSTDMDVDNMNTNNIDRLGSGDLTLTNNVTTNPIFKGTLLAEKCLRIGDVAATGAKIAHDGTIESSTNIGEQVYAGDIQNNVEDSGTASICMMGSNVPSSIFMGRQGSSIGGGTTVGELLFAGHETNTGSLSTAARIIAQMKVKAENIQASLYRNISRFEFGVETLGNANAMDTPALTIQREGNGNTNSDIPGSANVKIDGNTSFTYRTITTTTKIEITTELDENGEEVEVEVEVDDLLATAIQHRYVFWEVASPTGDYTINLPTTSTISNFVGMTITFFRKQYGVSGTDVIKVNAASGTTINGSTDDVYLKTDYSYVTLFFPNDVDYLIVGGLNYDRTA